MNLEEVLNFRRSVRNFAPDKDLDTEKVKHCLELATLAPTVLTCSFGNFITLPNPKCSAR